MSTYNLQTESYLPGAQTQTYRDFTPTTSDVLSADLRDVTRNGFLGSAFRMLEQNNIRATAKQNKSQLFSANEANEEYRDYGLRFTEPVYKAEADLLARRKEEEMQIRYTQARAKQDFGTGVLRFGTAVAGTLADPINIASMFIPIVGEAREAQLVARFGKLGARLITGAAEGTVGTALLEPMPLLAAHYDQADYTFASALEHVGMGAVGGAFLHTAGGTVGDILRNVSADTKKAAFLDAAKNFTQGNRSSTLDIVIHSDPMSGLTSLSKDHLINPKLDDVVTKLEDGTYHAQFKNDQGVLGKAYEIGSTPEEALNKLRDTYIRHFDDSELYAKVNTPKEQPTATLPENIAKDLSEKRQAALDTAKTKIKELSTKFESRKAEINSSSLSAEEKSIQIAAEKKLFTQSKNRINNAYAKIEKDLQTQETAHLSRAQAELNKPPIMQNKEQRIAELTKKINELQDDRTINLKYEKDFKPKAEELAGLQAERKAIQDDYNKFLARRGRKNISEGKSQFNKKLNEINRKIAEAKKGIKTPEDLKLIASKEISNLARELNNLQIKPIERNYTPDDLERIMANNSGNSSFTSNPKAVYNKDEYMKTSRPYTEISKDIDTVKEATAEELNTIKSIQDRYGLTDKEMQELDREYDPSNPHAAADLSIAKADEEVQKAEGLADAIMRFADCKKGEL